MPRIAKYDNLDTPLKKNLDRLIKERDTNAKSLAKAAGLGDTVVRDILQGNVGSPTEKTLQRLAKVLNVSLAEILGEAPVQIPVSSVSVIGRVQAGYWAEALEIDDAEDITVPFTQTGEYPNAFALKVVGDSMNLFYPDQSFVIVAPLIDTFPLSGDHVVVQRQRKDGDIEATIKEIVVINGTAELWPRSTNPKHNSPLDIHWPYDGPQKNKTHLVEICGVVVGSHQIRRRPRQ